MLRIGLWGAALTWVIVCVTGCSGGDSPTPETLPTLTPRPNVVFESPTPLIQLGSPLPTTDVTGQVPVAAGDADVYVQGAINALAKTLNVPAPSIVLLSVIEAQWPDSGMECPQPGQIPLTTVTPGYVIFLKSGDTDYEVHADRAEHYVVCLPQGGSAATPMPPDPVVAEFIQQARVNLATQLSVSPDAVAVISSEAHDWSDENLGCKASRASITPDPGPISGYKIVLSVGDKYYEYHTSFETMVFCKEPTE
jgi:hypothetical protein